MSACSGCHSSQTQRITDLCSWSTAHDATQTFLSIAQQLVLLSAGRAALPAFGMAVFKSPPPSRSPSAERNQPPPAVTSPATAAAAPATAVNPAAAAAAACGPSDGTADVAGLGFQPPGSKRKRDGRAGTHEVDMPSSSKQIRREGTAAEQIVDPPGPTGPHTFHLLKSHK